MYIHRELKTTEEVDSKDEPSQPIQDQWWSTFISVEKIERVINQGNDNLGPPDMSPRSHRSYRSFARSSVVKDRPLRTKTDKSLSLK